MYTVAKEAAPVYMYTAGNAAEFCAFTSEIPRLVLPLLRVS